jgi:serine-type D-Ala-D-Ala carboxypeptidase/endopeptidase (penicillin-binding protein 4)
LIRNNPTHSLRGGLSRVRPGSLFGGRVGAAWVAAVGSLAAAVLLCGAPPAEGAICRLCTRGPLADSLAAAARGLADQSQIGVLAVSLATGDTLLALNEDRRLIPGSNTKIFTTSAFLRTTGPDSVFTTRIEARGKAERDGGRVRFEGDLILRPAGIPDVAQILSPGSRGLLDSLAFLLRAGGLERVKGTVWIDGTLFADEPLAPGWAIEDLAAGYGALPGPVFANGNAATLTATGGPGRVRIEIEPPETPLTLVPRVSLADTGTMPWLDVERAPGSRRLRVTGSIPKGTVVKKQVAVPEPDSVAGLWLVGAMRRAGIRVEATVRVMPHTDSGGGPLPEAVRRVLHTAAPADTGWGAVQKDRTATVLAFSSPPAAVMVGVVNALSLNAEAEGLLRLLDPAPREKRRTAGLAEVRRAAADVGIDTLDLSLVDGSGLSTQNLATARSLVAWLSAHARDPVLAEPYRTGLAVPGETGTLKRRFMGLDPRADLRAKTGTLTNVSSLAGYVLDATGGRIAFAVITNGNRASATAAKQMEERFVSMLARYGGGGGKAITSPPRIPR